MIKYYCSVLKPKKSEEIEQKFPPVEEMRSMIQYTIPNLKDFIQERNEDEIKEIYTDMMTELIKFDDSSKEHYMDTSKYKDRHPLIVGVNANRKFNNFPSFEDILESVRENDPDLWKALANVPEE